MLKRFLSVLLMLALLVGGIVPALAEEIVAFGSTSAPDTEAPVEEGEPEEEGEGLDEEEEELFDPETVLKDGEFYVGATTRVNGMFFTNMWGNNTSDIDVRQMLHGYSPVVWTLQSRFEIDPQVVIGLTTGYYEDGNKFYGIDIAQDLTYNDGTPITAHDFVFSLMLFASPVIAELGAITTNSGFLAGSDEYRAGETEYFSGLHIVDDYSFTIEIKAEYLPFFFELGMLDCNPYPISVIAPGCEVADDGEGAYIRNIDPTIEEPLFTAENLQQSIMDPETGYLSHPYVSSGPYMLTDFDWETREVRFAINPYYKGYYEDAVKPSIDNIVLKSVIPETMIQELEEGDVQLLNKVVAADNIDEGLGLEGFSTMAYPRMGLGFINFANEMGPMQFEAVRKAFAYAVDQEAFRLEFTRNYSTPVYAYYGQGQWMVQGINGTPQYEVTPEEEAAWGELSLEGLIKYEQDIEYAEQLLIDDGWTLNENGDPFVKGTDTTRYKMVDGELMGLHLQFGKMQDSQAAQMLDEMIQEPLASVGITYDVTEVPIVDLLQHYYRQVDRTYDFMYLATNFISIFDPYFVFNTADAYQGTQNASGFRDKHLEDLALDLRQTEPGDLLTYAQKWLVFQTYWNEKLPMLPLYSNMYFDFFVAELVGYFPNVYQSWPISILHAYWQDHEPEWLQVKTAMEEAEAEANAPGEGDVIVSFED